MQVSFLFEFILPADRILGSMFLLAIISVANLRGSLQINDFPTDTLMKLNYVIRNPNPGK